MFFTIETLIKRSRKDKFPTSYEASSQKKERRKKNKTIIAKFVQSKCSAQVL